MNKRICPAGVLILLVASGATAKDPERKALLTGMSLQSTFDDTTDLNLSCDDGWIWTAETYQDVISRQNIHHHIRRPGVSIARASGKIPRRDRAGDSLKFTEVSDKVLFYKGVDFNGSIDSRPLDGSLTIACWIRYSPDRQADQQAAVPIALVQPASQGPSLSIEAEQIKLSLVARDIEQESSQQTLVRVKRPPVSGEKWLHLAIAVKGLNAGGAFPTVAALYLDGRRMGRSELNVPMDCDFTRTSLVLGHQFVGEMDDLYVFERALSDQEVRWIYEQPKDEF